MHNSINNSLSDAIKNHFGLDEIKWKRLSGLRFWITGAGTGYGQSIACALGLANCEIILSGRRTSKLEETIQLAENIGVKSSAYHVVPFDITKQDQVNSACSKIQQTVPRLDGIIHSAALPHEPGVSFPLSQCSLERWEETMKTNVTAPWYISRNIFSHMLNGPIRILFLSSGAGWAGTPGVGIYNISKAALNSLSHSFAHEYKCRYPQEDIQVNTLVPGEAFTEMNKGSSNSPFDLVEMTLKLLAQPEGGPNGYFFHQNGGYLTCGETGIYPHPI